MFEKQPEAEAGLNYKVHLLHKATPSKLREGVILPNPPVYSIEANMESQGTEEYVPNENKPQKKP